MSDWAGNFSGTKFDELIGDTYEPTITKNIEVGAAVERGMLMAATAPTGVYSLATAADTGKSLVVAKENFEPTSDLTITQAYSRGVFNREKIITSASDTSVVDALELEMQRQGLYLTSIEKNYNNN